MLLHKAPAVSSYYFWFEERKYRVLATGSFYHELYRNNNFQKLYDFTFSQRLLEIAETKVSVQLIYLYCC